MGERRRYDKTIKTRALPVIVSRQLTIESEHGLVLLLVLGEPLLVQVLGATARHLVLSHAVAIVQITLGPLAKAGGDLFDGALGLLTESSVGLAVALAAANGHGIVAMIRACCFVKSVALFGGFVVVLAHELFQNGIRIVFGLCDAQTGKAGIYIGVTVGLVLTVTGVKHPLIDVVTLGITSSAAGSVACAARLPDFWTRIGATMGLHFRIVKAAVISLEALLHVGGEVFNCVRHLLTIREVNLIEGEAKLLEASKTIERVSRRDLATGLQLLGRA